MTATKQKREFKTNQETWKDWLKPTSKLMPADEEDLLTRAELLAELDRRGVSIPETTLVEREKAGVLPRAVIQKHAGKVQATYPYWMVEVVEEVNQWLSAGYHSHWVKTLARTRVSTEFRMLHIIDSKVPSLRDAIIDFVEQDSRADWSPGRPQIAGARLVFIDEEGDPLEIHEFPLPGKKIKPISERKPIRGRPF